MSLAGGIVIFVIVICIGMLITSRIPAEIIFLGGLTVLLVTQVIPAKQALVGFSNQGMLSVAAFYVVAAGLKETGALQLLTSKITRRSRSIRWAQVRIMGSVMAVSAFINNTPLVASFIPAIEGWARKNHIPASKLLIPLSYAAILGGTCTLIGTSTNLIINGLLISEITSRPLGILEPALIAVPCAIAGFIYLALVGKNLLPTRESGFDIFRDPKEYTIEMMVEKDGALTDKTVEEAGLMRLSGLFMIEVNRNNQIISPVDSNLILKGNDRIIFVGILDSILDIKLIKGLIPAADQIFKLDSSQREHLLFEAVISQTNPLNGVSIKGGKFRNRYNGVILAVSRYGERINEGVGDIILQMGDTLLIEALPNFLRKYKNSSDFYLISGIKDSQSYNYKKSILAWINLGFLVFSVAFGLLSVFEACFISAGLMIMTGCLAVSSVNKSIDWSMLLVISACIGIANGLTETGTAAMIAERIVQSTSENPYISLSILYIGTMVLTEVISNNAVAIFIFPIAISLSAALGVNYMPFIMVIIMAASSSFATPIGYQTNLMVYGPGGYRFTDFIKIGLPLTVLVAIITLALVPVIWPF